ncbi:MAG: PH domain-containing protein [Firmicutes bacterium]|nr:PH domain-containing protein [Bacillota bacterium]
MTEMFNDVLENNEHIVAVYKPDKTKFRWGVSLSILGSTVWFYLFLLVGLIPDEGSEPMPWQFYPIMAGIITGVIVVIFIVTFIFTGVYFKNKFYAYTNRRIIIRSGILGIDYKSLEFKFLTATIVNVSPLDKILKRNTGSIKFGSPSSQIGSVANGAANLYAFKHILRPYDTLREIKEAINQTEAPAAQADAKKSALEKLTPEERAALGL